MARALVSCKWLKETLDTSTRTNLRVLESMWIPKEKGLENFRAGHIPTARYFDMWEGIQATATKARPLPSIVDFAKLLEREGVTDSSHLVLYDRGSVMFAPRMWLQCKEIGLPNVSVLDGGFNHWSQFGYETETGEPRPIEEGRIAIKRQQRLCGFEQVTNSIQNPNSRQIVDMRRPEHFRGEAEEPTSATISGLKSGGIEPPKTMKAGHMKAAKNVFFGNLVDKETGCFKSKEELQKLFEEAGVDITRPSISTCYNGITACYVPLAFHKAGGDPDKCLAYAGSWTEFGQKGADDDIEKSAPISPTPAA